MNEKIALEVTGLSKKFKLGQQSDLSLKDKLSGIFRSKTNGQENSEFWALKDLEFKIPRGEAVGVIGRNGAGKSTLLKIFSRITEPTEGKVVINGRVSSLLEVGTGFHPELTGSENIYLNGTILGMSRKEIKSKFDEIVQFSGVEKFLSTPVKHYSSGMYVRLAFAVAAHLEPEILIIDEVLAVGDAEFQKKCLGKMKDVASQGRTVIFVSHNIDALLRLCSRCIYLEKGILKADGPASDVAHLYISGSNDSKSKLHEINNHALNELTKIERLSLVNSQFKQFGQLEYELIIESKDANSIGALVMFFENDMDQRISTLDLRSSDLFELSKKNDRIHIRGIIQKINFLPGHYKVGMWIASNHCTGNFYDLVRFEILDVESEYVPFPKSTLGFIDLDHTFEISV